MTNFKVQTNGKKYTGFNEEQEKKWNGPFYFVQGADCQFGLTRVYNEMPSHEWPEEIELAEQSVKVVNALNPPPKFFVICGDLCNAFPDKDPDLRQRQEADFKRIYGKVNPNIPLVCVCGNHDVGDIPTPETVEMYKSSFGDDYFSFWVGGVFFIVLNSQFWKDSSKTEELRKEQERWLDEKLAIGKKANARIMVFQHIALFLERPDEGTDIYFNIAPEIRTPLLDKFIAAGVTHVICGHYHRNAGGFYKNLEMIVTSAIGLQLGSDRSGMRIIKVKKDGVEHAYHSFENFPNTVNL